MSAFTCNNPQKAESFKEQYAALRAGYHGLLVTKDQKIDTELVSSIIDKLSHGKAADFNGLSSEHLYCCHPSLSVILAKLFQIIMRCSYVPVAFRYSYTVPIPKPKEFVSKALTCDDFRGIAISPVISKIFEHCILKRFGSFLATSHNQFGFKRGSVVVMLFGLSVVLSTLSLKEVTLLIFVQSICPKLS